MDPITSALIHREKMTYKANEFATLLMIAQQKDVAVKVRSKYILVDIDHSGAYMIEIATGDIFGIRAYGEINRRHRYGNLSTIHEWKWDGYRGRR